MKEIYLDGAANTPLDKEVLVAMKPYLSHTFVGNSMSVHGFGIKADQAIGAARHLISQCLRVRNEEIYFTSGATESNNWAIKSVAADCLFYGSNKKHIICSALEHESVLRACQQVEEMGMDVTYVHPSNHKFISSEDIAPVIRPDTALICVMAVNNETGVANDVKHILDLADKNKIKTLVDCTQFISYGGEYTEIGNCFPTATFMSFSAHKIYGPLGVGCLIARKGYNLRPLIIGGSQERGLRGGTLNTAGIIGTAVALNHMHHNQYYKHYARLLSYLTEHLTEKLPEVYYNARPAHSNIISINCSKIIHVDKLAETLAYCGVAVSAGSACDAQHDETKGAFNGSHVLLELGLTEDEIRNTIRVSFTKYTSTRDLDQLIKALKEITKLCK